MEEGHMTVSVTWPIGGVTFRLRNGLHQGARQVVTVRPAPSQNAWVSAVLPPWFSAVEESLLRIAALEPGWDGERAEPMSWRAFDAALMVLAETMSNDTVPPQIVPTYDGGLQLEWHCAGVDLEVYIQPNGQVSAWLQEAGREWELNRYPRARLSRELSML